MAVKTGSAPAPREAIQELTNALQVLVILLAAAERDTSERCERCEAVKSAGHRVLAAASAVRSSLSALATGRTGRPEETPSEIPNDPKY